jgi:hypothetical protein
VTNEFDDTMLLDDVVMEASAEPGDRTRSAVKPSARHLSAVGRLRDSVREHLQPKPPEWAQPGPLERWTVQ